MFASLSKTFRSKTIRIGVGEAHMTGRGKYLDKNGYVLPNQIMQKHLDINMAFINFVHRMYRIIGEIGI